MASNIETITNLSRRFFGDHRRRRPLFAFLPPKLAS